jgi:hypothetical protein
MSHRKTDLGIPRRSKSAKVVLGWKVLSYQSVKEREVCFYGSADVFRANGLLSVWTKCPAKEDLNKAVKEHSTGSLSDVAAEKIAHDYVPPIAKVKALEGGQIIDAVIDEELANNGNIRPLVTALREIDCARRRARELSVIKPVGWAGSFFRYAARLASHS